tara:strand:- start:86 stop:412 length:327 start_codon:yes stop_codon:yes gene_type:complete
MNFTTKLSGYSVSVFGGEDMEGAFSIEWDFYTEMREWGVKEVGIYATKITGVIYKDDESVLDEDRIEIDSDEKGWHIDTDNSELKFGNSICPQSVYVDLQTKTITVNF